MSTRPLQPRFRRSVVAGIVAACLPLLMTACSKEKPDALIVSAKTYLAKNDRKAAVIQIKNALQADPQLPEARYLLGKTLLEQGDPVQAEVELRKAVRLGYSPDLVTPKLATAMLAHGEARKAVEEFGSTTLESAAAKAELATVLASAYATADDQAKAEAMIGAALGADPAYVPALLMKARLEVLKKNLPGAAEVASAIVKAAPDNPEGWRLKGDIDYLTSHDAAAALDSYRKAVAVKPDFVAGHLSIARLLLQERKLDEMQKEVDVLTRLAPDDPQVRYVSAVAAVARKDTKTAQEQTAQLLKSAPDNVPVLLLAASIDLDSNALAQAQTKLNRALALAPDNMAARRLLMTGYLRSGQPDRALATLFQGRPDKRVDPDLYSVAGDAYFQTGDAKTAQEYFAKAAQLDPKDSRKRAALAVARLNSGDTGGFAELQSAAASDSGVSADMALISAYMARQQMDKALVAIDVLEHKQPNQPLAPYYRGRVRLALRDAPAARTSFERALSVSPQYFPALASLTAMDLADRKLPEAKARLVGFLAKEPKNTKALMALAEVEAMGGASKEQTAAAIGKAIDADPSDPGPRLMLVEAYSRTGDAKGAMTAAQAAVSALPDNPAMLEALGQTQLQSGEPNQAVASFAKAAELQPGSARPYVQLARAQMTNKATSDAEQSLLKAVSIQPDSLEAQRLLAGFYVDTGRTPAALKIARTMQSQRPKEPIGYVLEGDIDLFGKDPMAAVTAFHLGLKQAPSSELAVKLHKALAATTSGKAEADRFAAEWQKQAPGDAGFVFYLGDVALQRQDYPKAQALYGAVAKMQPNNAPAYNNLAWIANTLHQGDAIALAEKAHRLAPRQVAFIDTLATVLAAGNRVPEAIALQRSAVDMEPRNPGLRLALAKLYLQSGDKGSARPYLDQLAALGQQFPAQAEVAQLLKTL